MACASGCLDASFCDDVAYSGEKCCESGGVDVTRASVAGRRPGEVDLGDNVGDAVAVVGGERGNVQGCGHHSLDRFVELGCHGGSIATLTDSAARCGGPGRVFGCLAGRRRWVAAKGFGGLYVQKMGPDGLAQYLGLAPEQLHTLLLTEKFGRFDPDYVWSIEDAERMYQELEDSAATYELDSAAALITEVRQVAEVVRAYGDAPYDRPWEGINVSVPVELHVIAAKLETALRGILVVEQKSLTSLESARRSLVSWAAVHAHGATVAQSLPGERDLSAVTAGTDAALAPVDLLDHFCARQIPVVFGVVNSICPPVNLGEEQRRDELRTAWERLGAAAEGLRTTLGSAGRGGAYMLSIQRGRIAGYLETVESGICEAARMSNVIGAADE